MKGYDCRIAWKQAAASLATGDGSMRGCWLTAMLTAGALALLLLLYRRHKRT